MRDGYWPDGVPVRMVTARALVDGVETEIDDVSLTAEMTPDIPTIGGGQLAATTGSVGWASPTVATTAPNPFMPDAIDRFAGGTPLAIEVGDGAGQWWTQLTGFTDGSTGEIVSGNYTSPLVDKVDQLSAPVRHDALLESMPSPDSATYLRPGLVGTYVTDLAARTGGFCATPNPATPAACRLLAPMMGSAWPHIGTLIQSFRYSYVDAPPLWASTDWGVASQDVSAAWTFAATATPTLTVSLAPQPTTADSITASVRDTAENGALLIHQGSDDSVRVGVRTPGGSTILGVLPRQGCDRAAISASVSGSTMTIAYKLSDGRTGSYAHTDAALSGWAATRCRMQGTGIMGGVVVEHAVAWGTLDAPRTARMRVGKLQYLHVMPSLKGDTALSLLTDQARAEGASVWIDADGVLQWVSRGVLEQLPSVATKTTRLTVDNLSWTLDYQGVVRQVTMRKRIPAQTLSSDFTVLLAQGNQQTLDPSTPPVEEWLQAGDQTDWILVDKTPRRALVTTAAAMQRESWYGGIITDDNDATVPKWATNAQIGIAVEWIDSDTAKVTTSALSVPAGKYLITRFREDEPPSRVPTHLKGAGLPIIRGKGKVEWNELTETVVTGASRGVANRDHDVSWWVQNDTRLAELKTWLVDALSTPRPEVTLELDYDPRLQLGDKITIEDPDRTGVTLDFVITGIRQQIGSDAPTMSLSGRVTRIEQTWTPTDPVSEWQAYLERWRTVA